MTLTASGTLDLDYSDETVGEFLMAFAPDGAVAYVGFDRFVGNVGGRQGSFVLHHNPTRTEARETAEIVVLANSATDELRGLSGKLQIDVAADGGHSFSFEYELAPTEPQH